MATITKKTTSAGKVRYKADIRTERSGRIIHRESKTFDRKRVAEEWSKARELELQEQGALDRVALVGYVITRYEEFFTPEEGFGRTKQYDLTRLKKYPLAS